MCSLKMFNDYICALDIGSSKIVGVIAVVKRKRISNLFFDTVAVRGIKKGAIINAIDLGNSIGNILKKLKNKSDINIKHIYANISGLDIVTKHSRAIIPLAEKGNKIITSLDIRKVNEQARILGSGLEEEVIQGVPLSYAIDSTDNILNPLGLYSHKLELDLYLICGKLSFIQCLSRIVNQAGYEIRDLFFSGTATAEAISSEENKEGVTVLCDIGCDVTELLIFKDAVLSNIEILSFGGNDLTLELCEALKIPLDLAEDLKISYSNIGDFIQIKEDREILIKKDNIYKPIKHKLICEILTSKTKLICDKIKDAIEKNIACRQINNFVIVGRTALLEGFLEILENNLGTSIRLGRIVNPEITSLITKNPSLAGHKYLTYLTSLGIVCRVLKERKPQSSLFLHPSIRNPILGIMHKAREIYQEYF